MKEKNSLRLVPIYLNCRGKNAFRLVSIRLNQILNISVFSVQINWHYKVTDAPLCVQGWNWKLLRILNANTGGCRRLEKILTGTVGSLDL
jgi:hypothetical protein